MMTRRRGRHHLHRFSTKTQKRIRIFVFGECGENIHCIQFGSIRLNLFTGFVLGDRFHPEWVIDPSSNAYYRWLAILSGKFFEISVKFNGETTKGPSKYLENGNNPLSAFFKEINSSFLFNLNLFTLKKKINFFSMNFFKLLLNYY
jgi:hypothetical protein